MTGSKEELLLRSGGPGMDSSHLKQMQLSRFLISLCVCTSAWERLLQHCISNIEQMST